MLYFPILCVNYQTLNSVHQECCHVSVKLEEWNIRFVTYSRSDKYCMLIILPLFIDRVSYCMYKLCHCYTLTDIRENDILPCLSR